MGSSLRTKMRYVMWSISMMGLLSLFANCTSYSSDSGLFGLTSAECTDALCEGPDQMNLELNPATATVVYPNTGQLPVSGGCNDGGFSGNRIVVTFYDLNGSQISGNAGANFQNPKTYPYGCLDGQFDLTLVLPNGVAPTMAYNLYVELKGIDDEGTSYSNVGKARKLIQVYP